MRRAVYETRCGWCDEQINPGDEIEDYDGEWMHLGCAAEARTELAGKDTE